MSRPLVFTTTSPTRHLGVRFKPGGITRFLRLKASALADQQADLSLFWGSQSAELWHRLAPMDRSRQVAFLRQWLTARVSETQRPNPYVTHCITRLQGSHGAISLRDLEQSTGVSTRQLERLFLEHVGLPPKHFSRMLRFLAAYEALGKGSGDSLAELALRLGYADQAHLTRELREFAGTTPRLLRLAAVA